MSGMLLKTTTLGSWLMQRLLMCGMIFSGALIVKRHRILCPKRCWTILGRLSHVASLLCRNADFSFWPNGNFFFDFFCFLVLSNLKVVLRL